jgi:hypothetical protein
MKTINRFFPRFTLASLCGLLFAAPSFVTGANIVVNGGFEDNLIGPPPFATAPLSSWTIGEVGSVNQNLVEGLDTTTQYALPPHSGSIAAVFRSNTNTLNTVGLGTLTQSLTTTAGQAYALSFWLANPIQDPADFLNVFSVSWNGVLIALSSPSLTEESLGSMTYVVAPQPGWFQVTANLIGTGGPADLQFSGRNSDWGTLLDDVSVQASGVPDSGSTLLLFAIAVGGLVVATRKSQRDSTGAAGDIC